MDLKTEFKYDLEQSFEYSKDGENHQATFLLIKMPTGRISGHTSIIDQEFQKAAAYIENNYTNLTNDENNKNKDKQDNEDDDDSYKSITKVLAAGHSDLDKCYKALKNILTSSVGKFAFCLIDGETKFGGACFDSLSIKDINNILGRYIQYFL